MSGAALVAASLLLVCLVGLARADFSINDSKLSVSFEGNSGRIVFSETVSSGNSSASGKQWWAIVWAGITECDGTKTKPNKPSDCVATTNKITTFANSFVFTPVTESSFDGVKQISVNGTAQSDVGTGGKKSPVSFTIFNSLFEKAVVYQNVSVPAHSFKFGFELSAWPFLSADNFLSVQLTVMNKDGSKQSLGGSTVQMGSRATLKLDEFIVVDNVAVAVDTAMVTNGNNNNLYVSVPNYAKTAAYDPVFSLGSSPSGTSTAFIVVITLLIVVAAIVALLLIVILVVVTLRRQRQEADSIYRPM